MKRTVQYIPLVVLGLSYPLIAETNEEKKAPSEMSSDQKEPKEQKEEKEEQKKQSMVDTALANENLSTFVTALKAADLLEVLNGRRSLHNFRPK